MSCACVEQTKDAKESLSPADSERLDSDRTDGCGESRL